MVFGYSFSDWEALVADDYEYVMPLRYKTKYAIPYLVQPILTQQLAFFLLPKSVK
jgi:hypothetical protein